MICRPGCNLVKSVNWLLLLLLLLLKAIRLSDIYLTFIAYLHLETVFVRCIIQEVLVRAIVQNVLLLLLKLL